jgi:glycosyltransferase involved in cell wall biosynthesis
MADWISNSVDNGLDFSDVRRDIRELWARSFESFARIAYHYASDVVALYEANGQLQQSLGASPKKLCVIPNGIDVERFAGVRPKLDGRPTVAFI